MDSTCLLRQLSATLIAMVCTSEPAIVLAIGLGRAPSMEPMMRSVWARVMVLGPAPAIGSCDGF